MNPTVNVKSFFGINKGHSWPVVNRGNEISGVQKILKRPNHVTGIPNWVPKIYFGQKRDNLAKNRTYRNNNALSLPDGVYLYLIEYNPKTNRFYKNFVRVLNRLESGSRHFQLPTLQKDRVIVAAGELSKKGTVIHFNLESGTYTKNLMNRTKTYMGENKYVELVKNALRNMAPERTYVKDILIPQVPGTIENTLKTGNVSFYYGVPSLKTKQRIRKELENAGITTNNARNFLARLAFSQKNSSPARASPRRSPRKIQK